MKRQVKLLVTLDFPCVPDNAIDGLVDRCVEKLEDFLQSTFSPGDVEMEWPGVDVISPWNFPDGSPQERSAVILTTDERAFLDDFLQQDTQDDQEDRDGVRAVLDAIDRSRRDDPDDADCTYTTTEGEVLEP